MLVENKMEKQNKLFGRNKYISPVIFNGNESNIGKVVKVKVQNSNQNTLFGVLDKRSANGCPIYLLGTPYLS